MPHHFAIISRVLAGFLLCLLLSSTAGAATFTVSNLLDDGSVGSLRWAMDEANTTAGNDTIVFTVSGTITLTSTLPTITDADGLTLDGTGQTITISGGGTVQVMVVNAGAQLTLESLTVADGSPSGFNLGGGIRNGGALNVSNSTFSGNRASFGGGIYNLAGTVVVSSSTFSGNSASLNGGSIYNERDGTLSVVNSTFSGNSSDSNGVGGIVSDSTLNVVNSTFSDNTGGSIDSSTLNLSNTILANSPSGDDCFGGTVNATGVNLIEDGSCGASSFPNDTDPQLGPLADNGGPTQTMALLEGSPAIDVANNGICAAAPVNNLDQRGVARPIGSRCDIGAYESEYGKNVPTATAIPTLSEWALMLLSGLVGILVWWQSPPKWPV